ncbi:MAG TPA: NnrS family protein [Fluviicoccus sp.]|nr:NnrS family protein [Fluviicoccus sp.]
MQVIDRNKAMAIPPLFRLGFRPFFLGAALLALLAIPLWLAAWHGLLSGWQPAGGWLAWHRHEMLFGFGLAVVAGFLLTAVQNWTGQPGLSGKPVAALAGVWLAGRIAWLADAPLPLLIPLELAFPLLTAVAMGMQLWRVKQQRNYPIVGVLALLAAVDAEVLIGLARGDDSLQRQGVWAGLWLVAAMMTLIGGRVIPFFTRRGLRRPGDPLPMVRADQALLGGTVLIAVLQAAGPGLSPHPALAALFAALGAGHGWRLARWFDRDVRTVPLLWSLHLAYAWLAVACLGMAGWHLGLFVSPSPSLHALTVGGMGGLILAMMARVTLGHTGRDLAPPPGMVLGFGLLHVGALARVGVAPLWPLAGLCVAATCWALAFGIFVWRYGPMLMQARVDGHPG